MCEETFVVLNLIQTLMVSFAGFVYQGLWIHITDYLLCYILTITACSETFNY